jgi:hypothetical protein
MGTTASGVTWLIAVANLRETITVGDVIRCSREARNSACYSA